MKKSKLFKTISFSSLALLMGIAGTMAFAPLGANPSLANANEIETTTEQGLITPKADDPVIYTTESGLEIKWGNAPNVSNSLGTGNLNGFPYFTTTANSTTYTWVIIGRSTSISDSQNFLFSNWKNLNKDFYKYSDYFFSNTYESNTPAGNSINSNTPAKSYIVDILKNTKPKTSSEIPTGCVLILSNTVTATAQMYQGYQLLSNADIWNGSQCKVTTLLNSYYSSDTFGFGTLKSSIQSSTLYHYQWHYTSNVGTAIVNKMYSSSNTFFVLDAGEIEGTNYNWPTYLTAAQYAPSDNVWCRSMTSTAYHYYTNTSGTITTGKNCDQLLGVRPACVIKLF